MNDTEDKKENNIHAMHRQRLLKQVFSSSPKNMNEHQLLEFLLHKCIPVRDTNTLAHTLINEFGTLSAVLDADYDALVSVKGVGASTAMSLISMREIFYYYRESKKSQTKQALITPQDIMDYFKEFLESKANEEFYVACLNAKGEIIKTEKLAQGGTNNVSISGRSVTALVLKHNASAVAIGHNHPDGHAAPSMEDYKATKRIMEALYAIDVLLVDHVIIGKDDCFSFLASGQIDDIRDMVYKNDGDEISNRIHALMKR